MTPRFLAITKQCKKVESLDCIRAGDGTAFESKGDRYRYIRDFYQDIYSVQEGENNLLDPNCIEDFLGEDIRLL
jgi:hypothetical protein